MLKICFNEQDIPGQLDILFQREGLRILAAALQDTPKDTKPWSHWSELARQGTTAAFTWLAAAQVEGQFPEKLPPPQHSTEYYKNIERSAWGVAAWISTEEAGKEWQAR